MSQIQIIILIYVIAAVVSVYIGYSLRKRIDKKKESKLIKELELVLHQELPRYKKEKNSNQVNWDRVFNMLKKEPKTDQILRLREEVDKQIRLHYSKKSKFSRK